MKALLLAAGFGSRLRPLTDLLPKPLCLFYGQPMLDIVYTQIRSLGIESTAINTHHLAGLIEQHIQDHPSVYTGLPKLSYEAEILGTGGAINPLRSWLGGDDLLICNGDIIADIQLAALIKQHRENRADATMVLLDHHKLGTTPVSTKAQSIYAIGDQPVAAPAELPRATFSGIHIVGPRLIKAVPKHGFQDIIASYRQLLAEGARIQFFRHQGFWEDLGTPTDYYEAHRALFSHPQRRELCQRLGLDASRIHWQDQQGSALCGFEAWNSASLSESFIMGPASGEVTIQNSLVYPGLHFSPGQVIRNSLVLPSMMMNIKD